MSIEITEKEISIIARQRNWWKTTKIMVIIMVLWLALIFATDTAISNGAISLVLSLTVGTVIFFYGWRKLNQIENTAVKEMVEEFHRDGVTAVFIHSTEKIVEPD